nr:RES family NAD+ phosphorylase [Marinicella sp. NBU2979]
MNITDSIEEQSIIENLLDEIKPRPVHSNKHYLLTTPFRYPPLKYGSRYGTTDMKSHFYAAKDPMTCLVECAYYRFMFLDHIQVTYDKPLNTNHLLFSCSVATKKALDLTSAQFKSIENKITLPDDHSYTQKIGQWACQNNGFDAIIFPSARHLEGVNYAITSIKNIKSRQPKVIERISCVTTQDQVVFKFQSELISISTDVKQQKVSI